MIELEHVSRKFGTFRAVDDISFSIQTGEIVGLLGPNGAGKTTTMRMITGYLEPSEGSIRIDGMDVTQAQVETKSKIGYMPESAPLYGDMIVADYLEYVAKMQGQDPKVKLPELCETCGLKEVMHKNISDLSRGNRQRVGLAHALMSDPEILILDEPTGGLDPNQVSEVRALIKKIGETKTVIISTHILSEVEMLCNRVIIISDGKKVADSTTQNLMDSYGHSLRIKMEVSDCQMDELKKKVLQLDGVASCSIMPGEENKYSVNIGMSKNTDIRPTLASLVVSSGWKLYGLEMQKDSLEDVFRNLTAGGEEK
ncbi:MAG: ATP-binding cassette domain-containing protein [Treponema sp.]|nr:ATP-binding cassette domain-containing protein [Treponema sp.]